MVSEFNILFGKEGMTVNVSEVSLEWGSPWQAEEGESFPRMVPVCLLPKFWHSCSLLCPPGHSVRGGGTEHLQGTARLVLQPERHRNPFAILLAWTPPASRLCAYSSPLLGAPFLTEENVGVPRFLMNLSELGN